MNRNNKNAAGLSVNKPDSSVLGVDTQDRSTPRFSFLSPHDIVSDEIVKYLYTRLSSQQSVHAVALQLQSQIVSRFMCFKTRWKSWRSR